MNKKTQHLICKNIVEDNEAVAQKAYQQGDYVLCFLLIHSLIEALLSAFLTRTKREKGFSDLIKAYERFLKQQGQKKPTFFDELTKFNQRRNRIIHRLWKKGYTATNEKLEPVCKGAFFMYGLFIEWLETFNPQITDFGFDY